MKQLLYTLLALFAAVLPAMAQGDNTHVAVNVDGTPLESLLTEEQKAQVTHLTITGTLAEDDYAVLRELLTNQLEELNLRNADIDTLPAHAFECTLTRKDKERTVQLPKSLVYLSDYALNVNGSKCAFILSGIFPSFGKYPYGGVNRSNFRYTFLKLSEDNTRYKYENDAIYSLDGDTLYTPNDGEGIFFASGGKLAMDGTRAILGNAYEYAHIVRDAVIPASVDTIGDRAFAEVTTSYTTDGNPYFWLTCEATIPPKLGKDTFKDARFQKLFVPYESIELYKNAPGWNDFPIFAMPTSGITQTKHNGLMVKDNGNAYIVIAGQVIKHIRCYTVAGQQVMSLPTKSSTIEICKDNLPKPCAIMRISFADGTSETIKLKP